MAKQDNLSSSASRKQIRVAAYMRMSTERQAGSIPNQRLALLNYARRHKMEIVKEYIDTGKSGLTIKNRRGLQSLIHDITGGKVEFEAVLVYDITRWGRFQDVDESAHYEFLCRNAGIDVIYCEELFENDGSMFSVFMKTFRRAKAAEDSRELSVKVLAGQSRLAKQGFKQGGAAGYGLRRISIEKNGSIRRELATGERKGALTDRVLITLGPQYEVAVVHRIYDWYLSGELEDTAIARALNSEGIATEYGLGRPWTAPIVHRILTSEKYIGTAIYNVTTQRMQSVAVANPESAWIRKRNAYPALIDAGIFQRAQELRRNREHRIPTEELLEMLRMVYREGGKLSTEIINNDVRLPSVVTFANRFQTLTKAYELAGVMPSPRGSRYVEKYRRTEAVRKETFLQICECIVCAGGTISPGNCKNTIVMNGKFIVRMQVSRAEHFRNKRYYRWCIPLKNPAETHFVIAVQLEPSDTEVRAIYLFPAASIGCTQLLMREEEPEEFSQYRVDSLEALFGLC